MTFLWSGRENVPQDEHRRGLRLAHASGGESDAIAFVTRVFPWNIAMADDVPRISGIPDI